MILLSSIGWVTLVVTLLNDDKIPKHAQCSKCEFTNRVVLLSFISGIGSSPYKRTKNLPHFLEQLAFHNLVSLEVKSFDNNIQHVKKKLKKICLNL